MSVPYRCRAVDGQLKGCHESASGLDDESTLRCTSSLSQQTGFGIVSADDGSPMDDFLLLAQAAEQPVVSHLRDLKNFRTNLMTPLDQAQQALDLVDADLSNATSQARSRAEILLDGARTVAINNAIKSQHARHLLPSLRFAVSTGKGHAVNGLLDMTHAWIVDMKQNAEDLRLSYVSLLDYIYYMMQCTQVSLDFFVTTTTQDGATGATGRFQAEMLLDRAFIELGQAAQVMQDCCDFWLLLHSGKQTMDVLEKRSNTIRNHASDPSVWPRCRNGMGKQEGWLAPAIMDFCDALEEACQQYQHCSLEERAIVVCEEQAEWVEL